MLFVNYYNYHEKYCSGNRIVCTNRICFHAKFFLSYFLFNSTHTALLAMNNVTKQQQKKFCIQTYISYLAEKLILDFCGSISHPFIKAREKHLSQPWHTHLRSDHLTVCERASQNSILLLISLKRNWFL